MFDLDLFHFLTLASRPFTTLFPLFHSLPPPHTMVAVPIVAPHFIGVILCSLLYGFTLAQTWYYFHSFPKDGLCTKLVVVFLSILGTAQVILVCASIYEYTIVWSGNAVMSSYVTKPFEASMSVSSVIAFAVQLIYAHRIWRLSFRNKLMTFPIVVLAFIALGCGGAMLVETIEVPQWRNTRDTNLSALIFSLTSIACDILIAGSQAYLFHKSRTGIGRLGGLITRLTLLVVNVGLLTSIDVALFLVLFIICPSNGGFIVPYILMSHFYLNSFLSVLNSRLLLRELVDNDEYPCPNIVASTICEELAIPCPCPCPYPSPCPSPSTFPSQFPCPCPCPSSETPSPSHSHPPSHLQAHAGSAAVPMDESQSQSHDNVDSEAGVVMVSRV